MYTKNIDSSNMPRVNGKILFQANLIKRSYRKRGNVPRAQIQKKITIIIKRLQHNALKYKPQPKYTVNALKK